MSSASESCLGRLPGGWGVKRLKYAVMLITDKQGTLENGCRYIGLEHVEPWTGRLTEPLCDSNGMSDETGETGGTRFSAGDVLFGKLRPYLAKVHRAESDGICSGELLVLRARDFDSRYLRYLLSTREVISEVDSSTYGAKMPRANWTFIGNLRLPIPPRNQQVAIADALDRETFSLDDLIATKKRLVELLEEKRFATISQLVTKGCNLRIRQHDSGVDWIGAIPVHWSVCRTKFVARLKTGHTPSRQHPEYWLDCTIPWFSLADIWQIRDGRAEYITQTAEKISELGLANSAAQLLPAGTVMVSRTASVGFSAIMAVPMATTQDFVNWICGPRIIPEYLLYVFRSMRHEFRRLTMGSTHQTIYMPDVRQFVTPLPPVDEQPTILAAIRAEVAKVDKLIQMLLDQIARLHEHRSALITDAVSGQIDIRNYAAVGDAHASRSS